VTVDAQGYPELDQGLFLQGQTIYIKFSFLEEEVQIEDIGADH
jgi:hypothetical protein